MYLILLTGQFRKGGEAKEEKKMKLIMITSRLLLLNYCSTDDRRCKAGRDLRNQLVYPTDFTDYRGSENLSDLFKVT